MASIQAALRKVDREPRPQAQSVTREAATGANLSAYRGETAMKTEDDLASGIPLLRQSKPFLVGLSRMLEPADQATSAELTSGVQAAGAERAAGTPGPLSWQRALPLRLLAHVQPCSWEFCLAFRLSLGPTK